MPVHFSCTQDFSVVEHEPEESFGGEKGRANGLFSIWRNLIKSRNHLFEIGENIGVARSL